MIEGREEGGAYTQEEGGNFVIKIGNINNR